MRITVNKDIENKKKYKKPILTMYDSLTRITLHGSCLCTAVSIGSCPGDNAIGEEACDRGFAGADGFSDF